MYDLFIIECLITLFTALAIIQPFIQPFRKIAGLAVLPIIAFLLSVLSLPAFGFRPELLPLSFLTFTFSVGSIPHLSDMAQKLRTDDYDGRKLVSAIIKLVLLLCVAMFAFIFLPKVEPVGWIAGPAVLDDKQDIVMEASELTDESRHVNLNVRFYYQKGKAPESSISIPANPQLPIIVVACPILGGLPFYEEYCTALASRGFLVAAFTRRIDWNFGTVFGLYWDLISSSWFSGRTTKADTISRESETNLLYDFGIFIRFLKNRTMDSSRIVVAGFGSGGASALMYGAQSFDTEKMIPDQFSTPGEHSELIASISLEGPPASFRESVIRKDVSESLHGKNASVSQRVFSAIKLFSQGMIGKIGFEGYRLVGKVPEARIPSLMIVSDKIRDTDIRDGRYAVLLRFLLGAKAMSAIVSFDGAGILDFTNAPRKYPLLSAFTPGLKPRNKTENFSYAIEAADASAAFILLAIERKNSAKEETGSPGNEPTTDRHTYTWQEFSSRKGVYIELGGEW